MPIVNCEKNIFTVLAVIITRVEIIFKHICIADSTRYKMKKNSYKIMHSDEDKEIFFIKDKFSLEFAFII